MPHCIMSKQSVVIAHAIKVTRIIYVCYRSYPCDRQIVDPIPEPRPVVVVAVGLAPRSHIPAKQRHGMAAVRKRTLGPLLLPLDRPMQHSAKLMFEVDSPLRVSRIVK